jgi:hypothetical protein
MADVQIAVIDTIENQVNVAVPGVQGPIGLTGSVAIAQAGTATEPGIRFESDTNTGIYNPGADQLAISTNAVERVEFGTSEVVFNDGGTNYDFRIEGDTNANLLFVDASTDRVGIGSSSPDALLTVNGIGAFGAGAVTTPSIAATGDLNTGFWFPTADTIAASTNGSERARIDSSGNLGIGISSPSSLLHLADAGDITIGTTTGTKIGTATTQKIGLWDAAPVVQPAAVANITTTATAGALPTPDGAITIADTATPTVTELLEYCVELETKLEDLLGKLRTVGIIAT